MFATVKLQIMWQILEKKDKKYFSVEKQSKAVFASTGNAAFYGVM